MARPALHQPGERCAALQASSRTARRTERARQHNADRLEHAIETASCERQEARADGDANTAFRLDVDLLGAATARQLADDAQRNHRVGRGHARRGAYDPYMRERADGLFAERREAGVSA